MTKPAASELLPKEVEQKRREDFKNEFVRLFENRKGQTLLGIAVRIPDDSFLMEADFEDKHGYHIPVARAYSIQPLNEVTSYLVREEDVVSIQLWHPSPTLEA